MIRYNIQGILNLLFGNKRTKASFVYIFFQSWTPDFVLLSLVSLLLFSLFNSINFDKKSTWSVAASEGNWQVSLELSE